MILNNYMKKFIIITIFFSLSVTNLSAKNGKGEIKLDKGTMTHFIAYLYGSNDKFSEGKNKKNNPYLMSVSKNGRWSYYFFCPATITQCQDAAERDSSAIGQAISRCQKGSRGSPCYIFAKANRIVWNNGSSSRLRNIPRKYLKDPYLIAQRLQQIGFYDDDISELPFFDYETGLVDKSRKITGEKISSKVLKSNEEKKPKIIKKTTSEKKQDNDVVKKLKDLNELFQSGVLTKEEFDKAKKKILD